MSATLAKRRIIKANPPKDEAPEGMTKFKGLRPLNAIIKECRSRGWQVRTAAYRKRGSDHISFDFAIGSKSGLCVLNTFNGRFFGTVQERGRTAQQFSSDEVTFEKAHWFKNLLNLVYTA